MAVPASSMPDSGSAYAQLLQRTDSRGASHLTRQEEAILALLAEEEELRLECSLREAQASLASDDHSALPPAALDEALAVAEQDALVARATYTLRQKIIQDALIADPLLKAVHQAVPTATATGARTGLLPAINERDILSMLHSSLSSQLSGLAERTAAAERDIVATNARNQVLAGEMVGLATSLKAERTDDVEDAATRAKLEKLDEQVRAARREWRIVKSLVSGVVAGSGVDWASDAKLLELVVDDEDEMG